MGEDVVPDRQATAALPEVHHLTDKDTADNPLRVGLIGLGSMRCHHVRVIRATEDMRLVAVADPSGDRPGMAGELPVLPDVHALADAGLDAAMVVVPTAYHEDVALVLAEAGVHTMVEKPIAHDAVVGRRVATASAERGLMDAVGYVERYSPALRALYERFDVGELGEVYQVLTRRQDPFLARISDVGVVEDLATHDIDLTTWTAGACYTLMAVQVTHRSGRQSEDMMVATGLLEGGIVVSHQVNWPIPFKERATVVTGEKGALVADILTGDLTFYANGTVASTWDQVVAFRGVSEGDVIRHATPKRESLALEQENFRDAVCGVAQRHVTMTEGVATLDVVEAAPTLTSENRTAAL